MGCAPRPRGLPAASSHWGRATIGHEELIVLIGQIWPGLHARRGNGARWDEPERARPPQARADFRSERDFWQLSYGHRMGILAWAKECTGLLDHARSVADFLETSAKCQDRPLRCPGAAHSWTVACWLERPDLGGIGRRSRCLGYTINSNPSSPPPRAVPAPAASPYRSLAARRRPVYRARAGCAPDSRSQH
jgi:hypothetical protein